MTSTTKSPARERILTTAHNLFYLYGIRATGIDRIIAESGVTKVTFYRHFPSKNDLVRAFLEYRHQRWLTWFTDAIERYGQDVYAIEPALSEWFQKEEFRGCAFINTVVEMAHDLPDVVEIAHRHKNDMVTIISQLLPPSANREELSIAIAVAIDGAIVRAQFDTTPDHALHAVAKIINALIP